MKTQIRHSDKVRTSERNFTTQVAFEIKRRFGVNVHHNRKSDRRPKSGKGI